MLLRPERSPDTLINSAVYDHRPLSALRQHAAAFRGVQQRSQAAYGRTRSQEICRSCWRDSPHADNRTRPANWSEPTPTGVAAGGSRTSSFYTMPLRLMNSTISSSDWVSFAKTSRQAMERSRLGRCG